MLRLCVDPRLRAGLGLGRGAALRVAALTFSLAVSGGAALALAPPPALEARIASHAAKAGVPLPLARAVIRLESGFRPAVVHRGNYGLMQLRLPTARGLGYRGGAAGLLDPDTNLALGMRYLAMAYRGADGDICRTIMRYQSGPGATRPSAANRAYCARAKALMAASR
jgi:soluble lytic murein transglycosylase-like protein